MWKPLNPGGSLLTVAVTVTTDPSTPKSTMPICSPPGVTSFAPAITEAAVTPAEPVATRAEPVEERTVADGAPVDPPVVAAEETDPALLLALLHPTNNRPAAPTAARSSGSRR